MSEQLQPGSETDAKVAAWMGWRCWIETRGEYTLAVCRRPGDREPWTRTQKPETHKPRYRKVTCLEGVKAGFFGTGFPAFSTDPAAAHEALDELRKSYTVDVLFLRDTVRVALLAPDRATPPTVAQATAPAFPLAVCRAALALEGK